MPEIPPSSVGGPPAALLRAVRRLLGPLVRLLLEHQITYPALTGLLKSVYVEEAARAFAIPGRPQTISRISLLTGIHRKDVKRLQAEAPAETEAPSNVSLGTQLVLRWTAEPGYQDREGRPRALPRRASDADPASFEGLVESVTQDIRPRAVLDEWLRLGVATLDDDDRVHLATDAFVPVHGFDEKAYFLGRNLHDHLAAARHNLAGEAPPLLERAVYYARLRPESIEALEALANEAGREALGRVNRRARALQREDAAQPEATHRMAFGAYFFREPVAPAAELTEEPEANATRGAERGGDGEVD